MTSSSVGEDKLKAAVLGGSIAGLMAGLVLQKRDFEVTLYEQYPEYIRSIQWSVRQSFINYLFSVDETMAEDVLKLVSGMTNGFRYLSDRTLKYPNGAYKHLDRKDPPRRPDANDKLEESCDASLGAGAIGIVRAQELEACLLKHLSAKPNVTIRRPAAPKCVRSGEGYDVLIRDPKKPQEKIPYDLIVVCVGGGESSRVKLEFLEEGESRDEFPVKFNPLSRERAQVCGEVKLKRRGMITQYQHAKIDKDDQNLKNLPSGELLFSALLSTDNDDTTCWVIGDVSTKFLKTVKPLSPDEKNAQAKNECVEIAARTMLDTTKDVAKAGVTGALGQTVSMFVSQIKLSSAAYAGDNLILAGDAVGAAHWAVGGGMHIAGMWHQKRLEALVADLAPRSERQAALEKYSKDVIEDTMAWISRSMEYYYLSIPKDVVDAVFKDIMEDLKAGENIDDVPNEIQKRIIDAYFGPKYQTDPRKAGFDDKP
jgi:2-polyprenyl-6-methoxyphenol hydroxylase-like FAD-dependent oxidoreductase